MSVPIWCNDKRILKMQNRSFGWLHRAIMNKIESDNIAISDGLSRLLEVTDQDQYGPGGVSADVADYLKSKQEVLLFAEIVNSAIKKEEDSFKQIDGSIEILNNFHQELLNYAKELE